MERHTFCMVIDLGEVSGALGRFSGVGDYNNNEP